MPRLAVGHTERHPENWLSGNPSVQFAVQAAETSEVVASFADAFTSVSVLTKPAVPGDLTAAAEFVLCVFYPFYGSALGSLSFRVDCGPKARISSVFFSWLLGLLGFPGFVVVSHVAVLVFSSLLHFGCFEGWFHSGYTVMVIRRRPLALWLSRQGRAVTYSESATFFLEPLVSAEILSALLWRRGVCSLCLPWRPSTA